MSAPPEIASRERIFTVSGHSYKVSVAFGNWQLKVQEKSKADPTRYLWREVASGFLVETSPGQSDGTITVHEIRRPRYFDSTMEWRVTSAVKEIIEAWRAARARRERELKYGSAHCREW